jgi:hypothetical protein
MPATTDFLTLDPTEFPAAWSEPYGPEDDDAMDGYEAELLARIGRGETLRLEAA